MKYYRIVEYKTPPIVGGNVYYRIETKILNPKHPSYGFWDILYTSSTLESAERVMEYLKSDLPDEGKVIKEYQF